MCQRQMPLPVIQTDGLTQRQPSHHPDKQHQMTLITDRAVLTQQPGELTVELGSGIHEDWIGVTTPTSPDSLPTRSTETRSVVTGFALVSGSQPTNSSKGLLSMT